MKFEPEILVILIVQLFNPELGVMPYTCGQGLTEKLEIFTQPPSGFITVIVLIPRLPEFEILVIVTVKSLGELYE